MNSRQSGRHIAEETKDKYEENDGGKEGAANIKFCALLIIVPMGHMWCIMDKKVKRCKRKKEAAMTSHKDRPTWM